MVTEGTKATTPRTWALFKKSDHLTQSDKMWQREDGDSSFDTYKSTKGEFLDFFNKTKNLGFVAKVHFLSDFCNTLRTFATLSNGAVRLFSKNFKETK